MPFRDVALDFWAFSAIGDCLSAGIVNGYSDGTYHPEQAVSRAQMAVFIARAVAGGDASVPGGPTIPSFTDVPTDNWAYRYIEYAKAYDVVEGYWDGYHPDEIVNRGQMAVYVARAMAGGEGHVPDYTGTPTFPDVTATNDWAWCLKYVEYCAAAGVVQGYWDGYHPEYEVTRDQMAVYVTRAFQLPI